MGLLENRALEAFRKYAYPRLEMEIHESASFVVPLEIAWETLADSASCYNPTPKLPIREVNGAPVTLAAAAVVNIRMEVDGTEGVRILASGDGATTATLNYRFGD